MSLRPNTCISSLWCAMSIRPECNKCLQELEEPGAIILSPPDGALVQKFHLCATCYGELVEWLEERGAFWGFAHSRDEING